MPTSQQFWNSRIPFVVGRASFEMAQAVDEAGQQVERLVLEAMGRRKRSGTEQASTRWRVDPDDPLSGELTAATFYTRFSEYGTMHQPAEPVLGPAAEIVLPSFITSVARAWRANV